MDHFCIYMFWPKNLRTIINLIKLQIMQIERTKVYCYTYHFCILPSWKRMESAKTVDGSNKNAHSCSKKTSSLAVATASWRMDVAKEIFSSSKRRRLLQQNVVAGSQLPWMIAAKKVAGSSFIHRSIATFLFACSQQNVAAVDLSF